MVGDSTTYWDLLIDGVPHIFGKPRLYTNDGTGVFTEVGAPGWDPMVSDGTHDVAFVDIDNDWDVDVLLTDVSPSKGHYLMVNDGAGGFVDQAGLLPVVSSNAWETEVADLDGDQDMDLYVVGLEVGPPSASWAGTSGPVRNLTNPIGSLGFVKVPGPGDTDINEAVLIDYDVDGDLDAFIAGLGVPDDQVHRNDGPAGFALVPGILPPGLDPENPTLDSTCADLDNDGDLDYLAVQGEYPGADWTNHLYLNSGPADTLQPVVQREELLGASVPLAGPWVVRTQVGDQVMDDGHDGLFASATLRVTDVFGAVHTTSIDGVSIASALDRFELTPIVE